MTEHASQEPSSPVEEREKRSSTDPLDPKTWSWPRATLLFVALALPIATWGLGSLDVHQMEGIVAEGALNMAQGGEIFVPRLHQEIYAYKPPLTYWLVALSMAVGGPSEFSLRLPIVSSGLAMALVIFLCVGRRLGPRAGFFSGMASITGLLALKKMRLAEFDMPLAALVGIAVTLAIVELTDEKPRPFAWAWVYFSLGLAFLAKGIPSLMFFGPGLLLAALFTGTWRRLFSKTHILGSLVAAVVVGGWLAGALLSDGREIFDQPIEDAHLKGLSWTLGAVGSTLTKPFALFNVFLPWTLVLPVLLRRATWRDRARLLSPAGRISTAAVGFVLGGLLVFMAVPATETRYLLPLAGPVGILCGVLLQSHRAGWLRKSARGVVALVGALLAIASPVLLKKGEVDFSPDDVPMLVIFGAGLLLVAIFLERLIPQPRERIPVLVLAAALGLFMLQTWVLSPHKGWSRSQRQLAYDFQSLVPEGTEVWVGRVGGGFRHSSLTYYLGREVRSFQPGELPPEDSFVILMGDEKPALTGDIPFEYEVLSEEDFRGDLMQLVRAGGPRGEP